MQSLRSVQLINGIGVNESMKNVARTLSGIWESPVSHIPFEEQMEDLISQNERSLNRTEPSWNATLTRHTCVAIMEQLLLEHVLPLTAIGGIAQVYSLTHDLSESNDTLKTKYLSKIPCLMFNLPLLSQAHDERYLLKKNIHRSFVCLSSYPQENHSYFTNVIDFIVYHIMKQSLQKHYDLDIAFDLIKTHMNYNYSLNNNMACQSLKSILITLIKYSVRRGITSAKEYRCSYIKVCTWCKQISCYRS
eukprot:647999_1